jgi:hypothetical protein
MSKSQTVTRPMRVQARKGSPAEAYYYGQSALPGAAYPMPAAIAPGISPRPLEDLIFHGGKIVPEMQFRNIYLGSAKDWKDSDVEAIDGAIGLAMQDRRLDNVMGQYFDDHKLECAAVPSLLLDGPRVTSLDEPGVRAQIVELFDAERISHSDLDRTIFNLLLPPGAVLSLDDSDSLNGLGGYHGSVHIKRHGVGVTLYYSANVYSQRLANGAINGIPAFDASWKDVVGTLYHEMNEFRTDADVQDAIEKQNNDFLGWVSRRGRECGDEPIAVASSLDQVFQEVVVAASSRKVPVQFMFSNVVHGPEGPIDSAR